jgi:L-lactate dehydrogenase complex protein LldG
MPWERAPNLICLRGDAAPADEAGLSHALAGVAETATLVLASGPENPTSLAFLPETHVVAVAENSVVDSFEDAIERVRAHFGRRLLPRALNLVSGPSSTGDIGGQIVKGAHGPRRLTVIVYGASDSAPSDRT